MKGIARISCGNPNPLPEPMDAQMASGVISQQKGIARAGRAPHTSTEHAAAPTVPPDGAHGRKTQPPPRTTSAVDPDTGRSRSERHARGPRSVWTRCGRASTILTGKQAASRPAYLSPTLPVSSFPTTLPCERAVSSESPLLSRSPFSLPPSRHLDATPRLPHRKASGAASAEGREWSEGR